MVIWNVETKEAVCGSQAAMSSAGQVFAITFCNFTDEIFVTSGEYVIVCSCVCIWSMKLLYLNKKNESEVPLMQTPGAFFFVQILNYIKLDNTLDLNSHIFYLDTHV